MKTALFYIERDLDLMILFQANMSKRIKMVAEKKSDGSFYTSAIQGGKMFAKLINQTMVKVGGCLTLD